MTRLLAVLLALCGCREAPTEVMLPRPPCPAHPCIATGVDEPWTHCASLRTHEGMVLVGRSSADVFRAWERTPGGELPRCPEAP